MREIKFRGMCANGVMRYGQLSQDKPNRTLYYDEYSQRICWDNSNIPVSNKTLGQFTGLNDKNGTDVFEGDILRVPEHENRGDGQWDDVIASVDWDDDTLVWRFKYGKFGYDYLCEAGDANVIGNIHENPELLK